MSDGDLKASTENNWKKVKEKVVMAHHKIALYKANLGFSNVLFIA